MAFDFDPGALLANFYSLPRGPRVCLRLARVRDQRGLEALFAAHGITAHEVDLARLVRSDPRRQLVICATALIGSSETVVGVGALPLDGDGPLRPSLLLVDEELTEGLDELLHDALLGRAKALRRGRAA